MVLKKKYFYIILSVTALCIIVWIRWPDKQHTEHAGTEKKEEAPIIVREYGIAIDSFIITRGRIKKNEKISQLMYGFNVSPNQAQQIIRVSPGVFDLRKIRADNNYVMFNTPDEERKPVYFVYEESPASYILIHFTDSLHIEKKIKDIRLETKTFASSISASLWKTMIDKKVNPLLAIQLSEIYAWTIDFFMLDKNDFVALYYEEEYTDSTSLGIKNILAAAFTHLGKTIYAIPFEQDGQWAYYDEEDNSLCREFLKAPLRFSRISSRFSHSRMHPILLIRRPHHGVDYAAPAGTPVYSIGDGYVTEAGYKQGEGKYITIRHNSMYSSAYLHLSRFAERIKRGKHVKQGALIGYVGSTGLSTGPHLDFRIWKNGVPVDPLKINSPPSTPIKRENKVRFDSVKTIWMEKLQLLTINEQTK